jgi:hypothetical protein
VVVRVRVADAEPHRHDVEERELGPGREVVADREPQLVHPGVERVEQRRATIRVRDRGGDDLVVAHQRDRDARRGTPARDVEHMGGQAGGHEAAFKHRAA